MRSKTWITGTTHILQIYSYTLCDKDKATVVLL